MTRDGILSAVYTSDRCRNLILALQIELVTKKRGHAFLYYSDSSCSLLTSCIFDVQNVFIKSRVSGTNVCIYVCIQAGLESEQGSDV